MLDYTITKKTSDSGEDVYIYCSQDGKKIPLNSLYSPIKEAERFSAKISTKNKVIFLIGMGNGSLIKYWARKLYDFIHLIIIEPFDDITPDTELTEIINECNNILIIHYTSLSALQFSSLINKFLGVDIDLIVHPNYDRTNVEYMREIISELRNGIKMHNININTSHHFRKDWILEPLKNLKYTYNVTSIEELKDKFLGERAVLVASGPSLAEQISAVKELKKSAFIFAAGSACNGLINNGLDPDFVTVFDSGAINYDVHFKDSKYNGPLITGSVVNSKIMEKHKGDIILVTVVIDQLTKRARPEVVQFATTPSVAILTLQIIYYMGFKEVYLVGQDLALVNDEYYAKGVHEHEAAKSYKPELYIESNNGDRVGTTYSLYTFLQSLESLILASNKKNVPIYNLSKNGAKIKGTQYIDSESIDYSPKRKDIYIELRPKLATQESFDIIRQFLNEFCDLSIEAGKTRDQLDRLMDAKKIGSIKTTERALKGLKRLRGHSLLEDVITPQLYYYVNRINNIVAYLIKEENNKNERELLFNELKVLVDLIHSFLKEIINDQRYKGLLDELGLKDNEKFKKLYRSIE